LSGQLAVQVVVGIVGVAVEVPMNPNVVLAPAASVLFQLTGCAVTLPDADTTVAFHACDTASPVGSCQPMVQPVMALVAAVTVTSPWKPPDHWFTIL